MNESNDILLIQPQNVNEDQVICPHCRGQYKRRGLTRHIQYAHANVHVQAPVLGNEEQVDLNNDFMNQLFIRGFGAPLLNSAGSEEYNEWQARWLCAMKLKGRQYILPQGSIGRQ